MENVQHIFFLFSFHSLKLQLSSVHFYCQLQHENADGSKIKPISFLHKKKIQPQQFSPSTQTTTHAHTRTYVERFFQRINEVQHVLLCQILVRTVFFQIPIGNIHTNNSIVWYFNCFFVHIVVVTNVAVFHCGYPKKTHNKHKIHDNFPLFHHRRPIKKNCYCYTCDEI